MPADGAGGGLLCARGGTRASAGNRGRLTSGAGGDTLLVAEETTQLLVARVALLIHLVPQLLWRPHDAAEWDGMCRVA